MLQVDENNGQIECIGLRSASSSTVLAPRNYWLFADLKKMLQGKRFGSNKGVIAATEVYFKAKAASTSVGECRMRQA